MKKIYTTIEEAQKAAEKILKKEEILMVPHYVKMYRGYVLLEEDETFEDISVFIPPPETSTSKQKKSEIRYRHRETFLQSLDQKKYETKKAASKAAEAKRSDLGESFYEDLLKEEMRYRLEAFETEERLFEPLFRKEELEKEAALKAKERAEQAEREKEEAFQKFVEDFQRKRGIQKKTKEQPAPSESCFQKTDPYVAYPTKEAAEQAAGPTQEAYFCPKCEKFHLTMPDGRKLECLGICFCTDRDGNRKELYKTRLEALKQLRMHKGKKGQELEIYLCPRGYGFHLTSRK